MSLDEGIADAIGFECEACGQRQTVRAIRKFDGACRKCHGAKWAMVMDYYEGPRAHGPLPLLLNLVFGIRLLERHVETIRIVTPTVPSDDALAIAAAGFRKRGRLAFQYMERRRVLDGERDRQIMREHGAQNCTVCGAFFMPNPDKPWTASGCCSKSCFSKIPSPAEPQFVPASEDPPSESTKSLRTVSAVCECGHEFRVAAIYAGTLRPCPACGKKTSVS